MLITIGTKLNSLDEAENLIENSVEISDYELVSCIPIIENGYEQVINLKDIKKMHENTGKSFTECFDEICAANKVSNPVLSVNESDYIEDDSLKSLIEYFSNYSIKKIPISSSPIYICAKKAIDELAYNGNGSLLESFMEDDYVPFSDSIYDSIINEAKGGHGKRNSNITKANKLANKVPTTTTANGSNEQQQPQASNATQPQQNNQSVQQNDVSTDTKSNSNNNNQPQTQNTAQQQKQQNTNSSAQPASNNNQSQPNTNNNQPQQNDDQQEQQKEKQVESTINNIEKEAENKPAGFISSKIAALRKLYQNWLAKKNQEKDQGKIGFFSNILRVITNCIDRLLAKLQGVKKAENDATGNNAQAANNATSQAQSAQTQTNDQTAQAK